MTITRKIQDRIDRLTAKPGVMLQLDIWPESQRVIPNSLARCALFTAAGKKEPRQVFTQERIASLTDMAVYYTGTELRQDDLDVWMQVVHMTRKKPAGDWIETSGSALLSALGWGRGADRYVRVRQSVMRMTESTIWVLKPGEEPGRSNVRSRRLIRDFAAGGEGANGEEGTRGTWALQLDPEIVALFAPDETSRIHWEQRLRLGPMAKWLHCFYSTHREPYPYRVERFMELCGSRATRLSTFRASLLKALGELQEAGFLADWQHDPRSDLVSVTRKVRNLPSLVA
jgi:hypothetical protein